MPIMPSPAATATGLCESTHLARPAVGFHREAHGHVEGANAALFTGLGNFAADIVDVVARVMELHVGQRALRRAYGLAVHATDETQQRLGHRHRSQDVGTLLGNLRTLYRNKADVVSTRFHREL